MTEAITSKTLYKKSTESILEPPKWVERNSVMLAEWKRITDIFSGTPFLDSGDLPLLERTVKLYNQYMEFSDELDKLLFEEDPRQYKSYSDMVDKCWDNYMKCCEKLGITSLTRVAYLQKIVDMYNQDNQAKKANENNGFSIPVPAGLKAMKDPSTFHLGDHNKPGVANEKMKKQEEALNRFFQT